MTMGKISVTCNTRLYFGDDETHPSVGIPVQGGKKKGRRLPAGLITGGVLLLFLGTLSPIYSQQKHHKQDDCILIITMMAIICTTGSIPTLELQSALSYNKDLL
jgi:hypothetical protein